MKTDDLLFAITAELACILILLIGIFFAIVIK